MAALTDGTTIRRAADPPEIAVGGSETVLLDVNGAVYYCLRGEVAVRIWSLLAQPVSLAGLVDALVQEFAIDRSTCADQVAAFVETLRSKGLVATTG